jgi:inhibitor of cysteine peptidase
MKQRLVWLRLSVAALVLVLAVWPGQTSAQGETWPPLQIQTGMQVQDKLVRFDIFVKNVSNTDLADVLVTATLPPGAAFVGFQPVSYATTSFDGQEMSYSIIKVPAQATLGPISAMIDPKGATPDNLITKIWAEWKGQAPGTILIPEATLSGQPRPTAAEVTLTDKDNGSKVQLVPGQKLSVSLESNPTTGYSWRANPLDEKVLKQLGEPVFKADTTGLMGAPGVEVFEFQAVGPGTTPLNMAYSRSWEKGVKPEKTFSASVTVSTTVTAAPVTATVPVTPTKPVTTTATTKS